jgi:hypothetical protein
LAEVHRLAYLFRNAHAIAKQNRPLTDLNGCAKLPNSKGLTFVILTKQIMRLVIQLTAYKNPAKHVRLVHLIMSLKLSISHHDIAEKLLSWH